MASTDMSKDSKSMAAEPVWQLQNGFHAAPAILACMIYFLTPALYFGTELFVSQEYTPAYSYKTHFTSQLGIPYEYVEPNTGLLAFSPRANFLNIMFVTNGILFLTGQLLLLRSFDNPGLAKSRVWIAITYLIGVIMVAAVPGGPRAEEPGGLGVIHFLGACLAIGSGNVNSMLTGIAAKKWGLHKIVSLLCGTIGLCGLVAFFAGGSKGPNPGLYQRITIYPTQVWMFFTADLLFGSISKVVKAADEEFERRKQE